MAQDETYRVSVCGEYASLFEDGGQITSDLKHATIMARRYLLHEERSAVSIHAFDENDLFSHVVEF